MVAKLPNSRRYQLLPQGYSICLVFLKLFERVYPRSPPACFRPLPAMHASITQGDRNSIASTSALSMISMHLSAPSASRPRDNAAQREQNPHYGHYITV
jgi:hypothetical protein